MPPAVEPLTIVVLGSGTSVGVPMLGCRCAVCMSADPRDKRLRPSVLVRRGARNILIDTTPDLRFQGLRAGISRLDAILFTHAHADHLMGLDDVRPLSLHREAPIPVYGSPETVAAIRRCFCYAFDGQKKESSIPRLELHTLDGEPFDVCGLPVTPVPVMHGSLRIYGSRFGRAAYITDQSGIPAESMEKLRGLDTLFLDGLRHAFHPTHSTVAHALSLIAELAPRRAFLTHICHDLPHEATERALPPHVRLAYDTLEVTVEEDGA